MLRTRVKICGMTSLADAQCAADLGADAIGLIFHEPSARNVSTEQAAVIAKQLSPFVCRVGVLVNKRADQVKQLLQAVPLDILQFHGQELPSYCRSFGVPYIKAFHIGEHQLSSVDIEEYSDAIGFLFDTYAANMPGGSGVAFNWSQIPTGLSKPVILAGGLTPDNVIQAIMQVNPYAVDITSGVEISRGKKDSQKMQDFIKKVVCRAC